MGSKSSAKCCQKVSSAVVFIFTKWNYFAINYLDDLGGCDTAERAEEAYDRLQFLLNSFGLKIATEKSVAPCTLMVFLGIEVNTVLLTLSIPADKWTEIQEELKAWLKKKVANLKQVQRLAGLLNFACRCIKSGCIYLSRILNFLRTLPKQGFRPIPPLVKHDVNWWIEFAPCFNGVSLITETWWSQPDCILSSNSCLSGGGCFFSGRYIHWKFPIQIVDNQLDINQLECMMVVIALKKWGKLLKRKRIVINCDNQNTVLAINSGASRDEVLQHCLRELHKITALNSCELRAQHIFGVNNRISDALSC